VLGEGRSELPDRIDAVTRDAIADLQVPHAVPLRLSWSPGMLWLHEEGQLGPTGITVFDALDDEELKVMIAESLQDQFFFETATAYGESRPACPGHPHPAKPEILDGAAWWTCPATGEPVVKFGSIAAG
jgi:hypothetical protein